MQIIIDDTLTAEWWSERTKLVIVRGPNFASCLDLDKRAFLDDTPDSVKQRAEEIANAVWKEMAGNRALEQEPS